MLLNPRQCDEIQRSIIECDELISKEGSYELFCKLKEKYTTLDPKMIEDLDDVANNGFDEAELDFRPKIKIIAERLKTKLPYGGIFYSPKIYRIIYNISCLIQEGELAYLDAVNIQNNFIVPSSINGPRFDYWVLKLESFYQQYLREHPLYERLNHATEKSRSDRKSFFQVIDCLSIIKDDAEFWSNYEKDEHQNAPKKRELKSGSDLEAISNKKIFLVHGHDERMKQTVARTLEKAGLEAIILHEKPNEGKTIVEKIEKYADVGFAVILYSPCDVGRVKGSDVTQEKSRARQNVVFEHGYLIGRLGGKKVCAIVNGDIEKPGDIDGVVYIDFDERGAWKAELGKELKNAGLVFDFEKLVC